jgi:hypothetical protein
MGYVVNAKPRLLYPRERHATHGIDDRVGPRAGLDGCGKSRSHRDSIPGLSSPYWVATSTELSRPTHIHTNTHTHTHTHCIALCKEPNVNIACPNLACLVDTLSMIPPLNLDLCTHKTLFGVCNGYLECLPWLCTQFLIIFDRELMLQHFSKYFVIWLHSKLYTKLNTYNYTQASILYDKTVSINNSGFNHSSAFLDTCLSNHSPKLNLRCSFQKSSLFRCEHNTMASNHQLLNCYSNSLTPKRLHFLHKISFSSLLRLFPQLIRDINLTTCFNIPNDQDIKIMYGFNLDKGCPHKRLGH